MTASFIPKFCLQEWQSGDGRGTAYFWTSLWSCCTQICPCLQPACSSGIPHGRSGLLTFTGSTGTCGEGKKQQQGDRGRRGGRQWGLTPRERFHCPLPASSLPSSWGWGVPPRTCTSCRDLGLVGVQPAAAHCLHNCWKSSGPCTGAFTPCPPSHHSWFYSLLKYFLPLSLYRVKQSTSSSFYIQKLFCVFDHPCHPSLNFLGF